MSGDIDERGQQSDSEHALARSMPLVQRAKKSENHFSRLISIINGGIFRFQSSRIIDY
jgi:hypothetical protein